MKLTVQTKNSSPSIECFACFATKIDDIGATSSGERNFCRPCGARVGAGKHSLSLPAQHRFQQFVPLQFGAAEPPAPKALALGAFRSERPR